MNANLQSQISIKNWLITATSQLSKIKIVSSKLDAEIILANAIKKNRTYLHAHYDEIIDINNQKIADSNLLKRLNYLPIAYIVGYKEFYGRNFIVNSSTLIPRPESEEIIEILKDIIDSKLNLKKTIIKIIDIGTGCGCLGITAKLEFPQTNVTLIDISQNPLKIAIKNAKKLSADIKIIQSDLLKNYCELPDIIIANLPYVDKKWKISKETNYEPRLALFADNNGISIIFRLINQVSEIIKFNGYIIFEADPIQHKKIIKHAKTKSFTLTHKKNYIIAFKQEKLS